MKTKPIRRAAKKVDFWWWEAGPIDELFRRWQSAGPGKRLKMWRDGDKIYFDVFEAVAGTTATSISPNAPINDSRACPPICP